MKKQTQWLCAALILFAAGTTLAQEYTNRREVLQDEALRQDCTIQGEYLAKGDGADEDVGVGLHLIADGGSKFRVVAYPGGLPGDGWKAGQARMLGTAEVNGEEIAFNMTEGRGTTANQDIQLPEKVEGKIVIERPQGGQGGGGQGGGAGQFRGTPVKIEVAASEGSPALTFEKQNRQSPTLGLEPPEGAVVLFNGTNLDWFPGTKMNESQRGNTLWAEAASKTFEKRPYKMHIEFMLSYMPQARGQGRSNSGVYIDERYECQVLDSFGLEGENNECGGFYQVAKPLVNMCFPPLTWQTYDIEFTPTKYDGNNKVANARVTVKHNGVVIHDNIEFQKETPGRKGEGPEPLGLYLQGHGNKVQYRNIWLQYQGEPYVQAAPAPVAEPFVPLQPLVSVQESAPSVETVVVETVPTVTVEEVVKEVPVMEERNDAAVGEPIQRKRIVPPLRPLWQRLRTLFL